MVPTHHPLPAERSEVANGPKVKRRWPSGPDQVAEKMQMHQQKGKHRHAPPSLRKACQHHRNHCRAQNAMQQEVMKTLVIIEVFTSVKDLLPEVSHKPRTIQVWKHSAQRHQTTVAK